MIHMPKSLKVGHFNQGGFTNPQHHAQEHGLGRPVIQAELTFSTSKEAMVEILE